MNNEAKVGLLVVIALAALAWLSVRSGSFGLDTLTSPMRELDSSFADVSGIQPGSAVRVAGVDVGSVDDIKLRPDGTALVKMKIKKSVPLAANVQATIAANGLIGEKYIALVAPPAVDGQQTALLAAGNQMIPGGAGADMNQIGGNFAKVSGDLEQMTATLRGVLGNPDNALKLQKIIDGMSTFSGSLQGDSGEIISNLKEASESLKTILGSNQGQAKDAIANISTVADNLAVITDRLKNGQGPLGQLLMADNSGTTGGSLGDLQASLKDLHETLAKVNSGQGTIGKLINDPQTAEKLDNALDTFSAVSDRIQQFHTEVAFEGGNLPAEKDVNRGEFDLTLQTRPTRFYMLGVTSDGFASRARDRYANNNPYYGQDFGREAKYTFQFGQIYQAALFGQDLDVRLGLKDSTAGAGLDTYVPGPYLDRTAKLSADLYDFGGNHTGNGDNSPQLDLKARMDLVGRTVYGLVGWDNLLNSKYSSPLIGLGVHFQDDDLKYLAGKAL